MESQRETDLIITILKAIVLAMGISVFVLNLLASIDIETSVKLLSLGLAAEGISYFHSRNKS